MGGVGRDGVVADTLNRDCVIDPDEDLANARLIAASPDLLAALELLESWARRQRQADDWPPESEIAAKLIHYVKTGERV